MAGWFVTRVENAGAVHAPHRARLCVLKSGVRRNRRGELPHVILHAEVSPVRVRGVLWRYGYETIQFGERGSPEAGVALSYLRDVFKAEEPTLEVGSEATAEGDGIRMRPILTARLWTEDDRTGLFSVGHVPPKRAPKAAAEFMRKFLRLGGVKGGDVNTDPKVMRARLKGKYRAVNVLGVAVPLEWDAKAAVPVNTGSDHLSVDVPMRLPRRSILGRKRNPWRQIRA